MPGESLAATLRWQGPAVPWVAGGHVPLWSDLVTSPHEEMSGVRCTTWDQAILRSKHASFSSSHPSNMLNAEDSESLGVMEPEDSPLNFYVRGSCLLTRDTYTKLIWD